MKQPRVLLIALLIVAAAWIGGAADLTGRVQVAEASSAAIQPRGGQGDALGAEPGAEIDGILDRLARVAGLYRDTALEFTCRETITDTRFRADGRVYGHQDYEFAYIYVFDEAAARGDPSSEAGLMDYRMPFDGNATGVEPERVELRSLGLSAFLERAYSWAFLFQRSRQRLYEYAVVDEDEILGRHAWIVSFEPRGASERVAEEWLGKVWVDQETYQLLRVEASRVRDLAAARRAERERKDNRADADSHLVLGVETDFGVLKNGMRFPSRVRVEGKLLERSDSASAAQLLLEFAREVGRTDGLRERKLFEVRQAYDDYLFFSVRTEAEIRALVRDPGREAKTAPSSLPRSNPHS